MRKQFAVLSCLLTIAVLSSGVAGAQTTDKAARARQKTFEAVWRTVNDNYFDPAFGGVDWAAVRQRYTPRVAATASDAELYGLLDSMLKEIPISHLRIHQLERLDALLARSLVTTGVALRDIDGQVVVTRVLEGSPAEKAGLRAGFAIVKVDDATVTTARATEQQLADAIGKLQAHRLTLLDEADAMREVVVENQLPAPSKLETSPFITATRYSLFEAKRLPDDVGYIHFTNFIAPLKRRLLTAFESMSDAPGMVIDLRGNSGGDEQVGLALAGMLVDKETPLAITRTRKGVHTDYKARPQKKPYRGPVAILIDEESNSESVQVSAGLQEAGRAVVIGRTSKGEVMDATIEELPTGALLLYPIGLPRTMKGVVLEGRGVIPDIDVKLTRAELSRGKDSQLEAAIRHLQAKR